MNSGIFVALIDNAALLLALVVVYDIISRSVVSKWSFSEKIFSGLIIGVIGIAVMMNPWRFKPGIVFDTRSILLSVTGLFFGLVPTLTAATLTAALRIYNGGSGVVMGIAVIITSSASGLVWSAHRASMKRMFKRFELYVFGLVVHMLMILCVLFLPQGERFEVFATITLPVMVIYPLATVLVSSLLDHRYHRISGDEAVRANERRFRKMMEKSGDIITLLDDRNKVRSTTDSVVWILGYNPGERIGHSAIDIIHPDDVSMAESALRSLKESPDASVTLEVRYRHKNHGYVWMESSLTNMLNDPDVNAIVVNSRDITYRKRAEEELRTSARRLSLAADAGKVGIWEYDVAGGTLIWDDRMYALYGIDREEFEITYERWKTLLHPDDRPAVHQEVQDAIAGRKEYHTQFRTVCPDGGVRYIEAHGDVYRDADGNPVRMIGVNWDITGRMETERDLRESEARFRLLVENAPDAIYVQTGLKYRYMNSKAVELFGAENADQLLGESTMDRIHPDFHDIINERVRLLTEDHLPVPLLQEVYLRVDGSPVDVEASAVPIKFGGEDGTLVFVRDVTERTRTAQSLKDSEERYRQLFNTMMNGFALHEIICDDSGRPVNYRFLEVNPAFERLTGLEKEKVIGRTVLDIMPGLEPVWIERYGEVALTGEPVMFEDYADELGKYYHVTAYRPRERQFAVIFDDVTAQKKVEEERKRIESQLRQAQKMEAVGRLAGGVAHDFNNMLNVILGNVDIAMTQLEPEEPLTIELQEIRKAGERSADLTRQLLAFSRKQLVEPKIIDLNAVIAGQKKMLDRLIGEDIDITFIPAEDIWSIRVDPLQVSQVLTNLAINSRDAIRGVGAITIETVNVSLDESYSRRNSYVEPGEYVMMSFTDTGSGMDTETLDQAFEPFFTTKQEGSGTGLGLATVYGIVKQNSGVINVYSEPGMGTTFKLYFPRHVGKPETTPLKPEEKPLSGHETILIVEDEEQILDLARKMLEQFGYHIMAAKTPKEACHIAEQRKGGIHLLLTDVVMPTMNGRELESRIRELAPDIKTLFMSGYTANVIAERGIIDKSVNFIHKPFSMKGLAKKTRDVLDS